MQIRYIIKILYAIERVVSFCGSDNYLQVYLIAWRQGKMLILNFI